MRSMSPLHPMLLQDPGAYRGIGRLGSLCKRDPTGQPGTTPAHLRGLTAPLTLLSTKIHLLGKQLWDPLQRLQGMWIHWAPGDPCGAEHQGPHRAAGTRGRVQPLPVTGQVPQEPGVPPQRPGHHLCAPFSSILQLLTRAHC